MPISKLPKPISGRQFSGVLLEPMKPLSRALVEALGTETTYEELNERHITRQIYDRIDALTKHYGVDFGHPNGEANLFLALAFDFLVCFNFSENIGSTKRGPKKGHNLKRKDLGDLSLLVMDYESRGNRYEKRMQDFDQEISNNPVLKDSLEQFDKRLRDAARN